jgi:hypothetical protein
LYHYGTTAAGGYYGGAHTYSAYHSPYYGTSGGVYHTYFPSTGGYASTGVYYHPGYSYYPY